MDTLSRWQGAIAGLVILFGVLVGMVAKLSHFGERGSLVAGESFSSRPGSDTKLEESLPDGAGFDGYTILDKDAPIYVVETEEDNTIKCAAGHYQNNNRTGNWEFYYPNGTVKAVGEYENGNKVGMWKFFYVNGQIMSEGRYESGRMSGNWISYHPTGGRKAEGGCHGGVKHGLWTEFPDETRQDVFWKGYYDNGNLQGDWQYFENGVLTKTLVFNQGVQIGGDEKSLDKSFNGQTMDDFLKEQK